VPVVGDDAPPPPQPGVPIPPVPAAELSFWDLFPEDLPPARPAAFPAEEVVVEHLALPEGPDSAAERLASADEPPAPAPAPAPAEPFAQVDPLEVASPEQERPAQRPEAEIVIAELLDGPPPTGTRMSAESQWAPRPDEDDIVINDLLVEPPAGQDHGPDATEDDDAGDDLAAATRRASSPDQARIAADRARRRRSRRGGGRGNQSGSG
jgi:hypothetical protein